MSAVHWALLKDLPGQARSVISAKGPDVLRFLQGLLSQDVEKMPVNSARAATLLTIKGKICWDAIVLRIDKAHFELAVPSALADAAFTKLDRHLIMDEVELTRAPEGTELAVYSGVAPRIDDADVAYFAGDYPLEGAVVRGPETALRAMGDPDSQMDASAFSRQRVSTGVPAWGFEVEAERFPPEVGLVRAVSYDKGCFMGQEPLARIHARGQTNWVLARVSSEAELGPCEPGKSLSLSHVDREQAGRCTTWVQQPASASRQFCIGLAILRRPLAKQGTELTDEKGRAFRVLSGPLGDDQGNSSNQARRATVTLG